MVFHIPHLVKRFCIAPFYVCLFKVLMERNSHVIVCTYAQINRAFFFEIGKK